MRIATILLGWTMLLPVSTSAETLQIEPLPSRPSSAGAPQRLAAAAAKKKAAPEAQTRGAYSASPLAERVALQLDLAWTGEFNGLIDGEINDKAIAAVKAFQKSRGFKETGVLAPAERSSLAEAAKAKQGQVGWRLLDDTVTGAQIGLPTMLVPNASRGKSGTHWSSAQGQVQVETFRIREPGTTLASVFEQQKKEPASRKVEFNLLRQEFFILSGTQGLKKFHVRAEIRDGEVRGLTILYDQATEGIMDPVAVVMWSSFAPFPGSGIAALVGPPPRRKVEYATGVVVSAAGHVLTDRQATEGCHIIELAGYGSAERLAKDETTGLALLRAFGARLAPAVLAREGAMGPDVTLIGITDPQTQGGANAVSTVAARITSDTLQPVPPPGFAGAAAIDKQGRVIGMVHLGSATVATRGSAPGASSQASIADAQMLRKFLDAHDVTAATETPGMDAVKAALLRVICIRR